MASHESSLSQAEVAGEKCGRVALLVICYGNYRKSELAEDLISIFEHNAIPATLVKNEKCGGTPKLKLDVLEAVNELKNCNIPTLI